METLLTWIDSIGGPVVVFLLLLSSIALTLVVFKTWQAISLGKDVDATVASVMVHLQSGELNEALMQSRNQVHPRLQILANSIQLSAQAGIKPELFQQEIRRGARQALLPLFTGLRPLEVIATVAPLLGLFGTVLGMIEAFKAMEAAGAQVDPSVLSGGIWQALLTTAYGLAVAIPASLIHSLFERKAETQVQKAQDLVDQLLFHFGQSNPLNAAANTRASANTEAPQAS